MSFKKNLDWSPSSAKECDKSEKGSLKLWWYLFCIIGQLFRYLSLSYGRNGERITSSQKTYLLTMSLAVVFCNNSQFWLFRLMLRKWLRVTQIFGRRSSISIFVLIRWNNFLTVTETVISDLFRHIMQYLECNLICLFFNFAICFLNLLSLWMNMCYFS